MIPGSVTKIEGFAFARCTGLTSVAFSEGLAEIGSCAFEACTALTAITIPSTVTRIEHWAFHACVSLRQITFRCGFEKFGPYEPLGAYGFDFSAFDGCKNLTDIAPRPSDEILERYFQYTPIRGRRYQEKLQQQRRAERVCQHCGSPFTGLFRKICSNCGKPKDY